MAKYIIWFKEIPNQQSFGLHKIVESDEDLIVVKNQLGEDYYNTYFDILSTTDDIFYGLQENTLSFTGGTKENPIFEPVVKNFKNLYEWVQEIKYIVKPLKFFIENQESHPWKDPMEKWIQIVEGSEGNASGFTFPYSEYSGVLSFCKTLLNPVGKPADAARDRAFSPLQLP
jgi:hypothetical protein